jgi:Protein of unknown function (DUF3298)/Deacetylase PdaC
MRTTHYFLLSSLCLTLFACKQETKPTAKIAENVPAVFVEHPLVFKMETIEKLVGDTVAKKKDEAPEFARISFAFPKASGGKKGVSDSINEWVSEQLKSPINLGESSTVKISLDSTIKKFFADHATNVKESPGSSFNAWENSVNSKVLFQNNKIACLEASTYAFNGGAHPSAYVADQTFDLNTGKKVEIQKYITNMTNFLALVEKKFRAEHKIPAKKSLEKAGFTFENGKFVLPENIGVSEKGLTFFYNAYEVAAYAMGPTEFFIPFEEMTGMFNKDLLF